MCSFMASASIRTELLRVGPGTDVPPRAGGPPDGGRRGARGGRRGRRLRPRTDPPPRRMFKMLRIEGGGLGKGRSLESPREPLPSPGHLPPPLPGGVLTGLLKVAWGLADRRCNVYFRVISMKSDPESRSNKVVPLPPPPMLSGILVRPKISSDSIRGGGATCTPADPKVRFSGWAVDFDLRVSQLTWIPPMHMVSRSARLDSC